MIYCYICDKCGNTADQSRSIHTVEPTIVCEHCTRVMRRDYQAEHTGVRGNYKSPIVMQSMAIMPDEVAKHRELHPTVELRQVPGGMYAPVAHSLGEKRQILKSRGWADKNSYV